ncbi:chloride channel protein [Saccharibacter floricola]|uniref:Chloride channel protein n=1 Tax=Saccharibacter floricola DSM 15669 TaxID=1123227 RepID=A0ABQ0NWQ9_9PROT|nr:chloride channel protein [Saccharibacter floricola]GBQ05030.1 chloride channel protein [Saccharibacter floricola DSM 15669]
MGRLSEGWERRFALHVPPALRVLVRKSEVWLTILAGCVGALGGLCVLIVTNITLLAHSVLYGLHNGGRLSGLPSLPLWRCVLALGGGGLVVGLFGLLVSRLLNRRPVDPVEANALHGGRMSVRESLLLVMQTILSNGAGASIGLEAGYTQISAALGSRIGQAFRVRREDLRMLVGAGAAGAIGAAFDAPIAGAFYAFELIIGTYSIAALCPVAVASVVGVGIIHLVHGHHATNALHENWHMGWHDCTGVAVLSIACALSAIAMMYCVTQTEAFFRRFPLPAWGRPVLGGALVALIAAPYPSVLSAGHAGMGRVLAGEVVPQVALLLFVMKALASCLSIGAGFRGGLFFASLYLGALAGEGYGALLAPYGLAPDSLAICAVLGMSAMAVAIIGGPMTIICMMLEITDNASIGGGVVLAAVLSLLTVRRLFGYNFATWRFHLRGESIRSAVDVGWMRSLTVQRLMRDRVRSLPVSATVAQAQALYPLETGQRIIVMDSEGRYEGMVAIAELHLAPPSDTPIGQLAHFKDAVLLPTMSARDAVEAFAEAEADVLVVVEDRQSRQVVGQLSEQYTLRRYTAELERCRRELAGEDHFSV